MDPTAAPAPPVAKSRRKNGFCKQDFHRSPRLVFYEVTQACGLVCKHCRARAQTHPHPDELSSRESFRLIDQLTEFPEPPMLVLTGGDPFSRADICELIEYATAAELKTSITPSATALVTREAVERLRKAGIHRMAISLDGADAKTHDRFRGVEGSFARSLEILRDAQQIGLPTQVNTTLTPDNLDHLDAMVQLLADLEIVLWSLFFLVPVGRAEHATRLSSQECERVFRQLWDHAKRQPFLIKTTEAPHYRRFSMQQERLTRSSGQSRVPFRAAGLNDGKGVMFVGHTGEIYPSGFLPILCGQYPQDSVVRVYQNSWLFQELRDANRLEGKCRQCEYRTICGGSRARAFAVTGDPFAEEPDCEYIPPPLRDSSE